MICEKKKVNALLIWFLRCIRIWYDGW